MKDLSLLTHIRTNDVIIIALAARPAKVQVLQMTFSLTRSLSLDTYLPLSLPPLTLLSFHAQNLMMLILKERKLHSLTFSGVKERLSFSSLHLGLL